MGDFKTVLEGGAFFECPRWHEGRWYVSDFYRYAVYAVDPDGSAEEHFHVDGQPSGIGWLPDGSLIAVSKQQRKIFRRDADGGSSVHADLSDLATTDLNDMVVSSTGDAYVGEFGFDTMTQEDPAPAGLFRVAPDGTAKKEFDDLRFPNGSVITPDGKTLIVGESVAARYRAYDITADGSLANPRVWAQMAPSPPFEPPTAELFANLAMAVDGCCLDAEGHIWAADAFGGRLIRIAPGGEIVEELPAPAETGFIACALGGEDRRTMLIAAGPLEWNESVRSKTRDGVLLSTTVEVPGAGLP